MSQNIAVARAHKKEGNDFCKKQIKQALSKYRVALLCLKARNLKEELGTHVKDQLARL